MVTVSSHAIIKERKEGMAQCAGKRGRQRGREMARLPITFFGGSIVKTVVPLVLISKVSIVREYLRNYVETLVIALVCGIYWILGLHNCF